MAIRYMVQSFFESEGKWANAGEIGGYKNEDDAVKRFNMLIDYYGGKYRIVKRVIQDEVISEGEKKYRICEFCKNSSVKEIDALSFKKFYECKNGWDCSRINKNCPCAQWVEK